MDHEKLLKAMAEVVNNAVEQSEARLNTRLSGIDAKVTSLDASVVGDGESGLKARMARTEERIGRVEGVFGKLFAIATLPVGALMAIAINQLFGGGIPHK